jgi:DNA-binding response OmpR family regulator
MPRIGAHIPDRLARFHRGYSRFRASMNRKGLVFLFEPDDQIRELLERWLTEAGYDVQSRESIAELAQVEPSLVIANLPSPHAAGTLLRPLRAAYSAPILALSGRFQRGLGMSASASRVLGVSGVLPKPFTRKELLCAVRTIMEEPH